MTFRATRIVVVTLVALLASAGIARATMKIQKDFLARYPEGARYRNKCGVCHAPGRATRQAPLLNGYGAGLKAADLKFEPLETRDSDKDGATDLAEIKAQTNPGDAKDKPGRATKSPRADQGPAPADQATSRK